MRKWTSSKSSPPSWMFLARAIVVIQVLLLCSQGARATEFNFGFDGAARPTQEATLIVQDLSPRKFGIRLDTFLVRVFSVDGKDTDKSGNQLSGHFMFGVRSNCETDCTIRLLPGAHSIEVNYFSGGYPISYHGAHNLVETFTAKPGKKYRLFLAVGGGRWSAPIREVPQ